MKIEFFLNKPEYFFNLKWIIRNCKFRNNSTVTEIKLPWNLDLSVFDDLIGKSIKKLGVHELTVTELIYRVLEPGNSFIDIGANIGYMTSIAAKKMNGNGRILCFEPHPIIFDKLSQNTDGWKSLSEIELFNLGLSDTVGSAVLTEGKDFVSNLGTAQIKNFSNYEDGDNTFECKIEKLDNLLLSNNIKEKMVIKIDIEGHEINAFKGMAKLLESKKVNHIIYEDHKRYPSDTSDFLENFGYKIYGIEKRFFGPKLTEPATANYLPWESSNYVATINEVHLISKMSHIGWKIFKN